MSKFKSLVDEYKGSKEDTEYKDILFYKDSYNNLLSLFNGYPQIKNVNLVQI